MKNDDGDLSPYQWEFRARFRRRAFGWQSQPAIKRIKEAVSELKKVARKDQLLAAEGAVLFIEKISPAIEQVDGSSGAIGSAVNSAIKALVEMIETAAAQEKRREQWLERLWQAYQDDRIPYIEVLGDYWGELCSSKELASRWADRLLPPSQEVWSPTAELRSFFKGTSNCLSALCRAGRYDELLALLAMAPYKMWEYQQYGVKALVGLGKKAEAIRYAEENRGLNDSPIAIARACEEILLSSGFVEEAYERYGILANEAGTYAVWFRAVVKKYPQKKATEILERLVARTPGEEGKWFAAAKDAKLFDEAIALANSTPGSPQTLTRAARDFEEKNPKFAIEAGMAALRWLVEGYGYKITGLDVLHAYSHTMKAAENAGCEEETQKRIHDLVARESFGERFVTRVLGSRLGLS